MNNNYSYDTQSVEPGLRDVWGQTALRFWDRMQNRRGLIFGLILLVALSAFELFNFSTTEFALTDMLGELTFAGIRWATILSIAFCGIDFAGLARLFTPERGQNGYTNETWYLIGAWFLGATMNAMMTWWAVSLAMLNVSHQIGNEIMSREQLLAYVPVFVAALVWLTRILIIGTFSMAGERLFSQAEEVLMQMRSEARAQRPIQPQQTRSAPPPVVSSQQVTRPVSAPVTRLSNPPQTKVIGGDYDPDDEPVYMPIEPKPRPASITPPPAASIRPTEPYRAATRPAPKPMPARENGHSNGNGNGNGYNNGNGHHNGNGNGNGNSNGKW
jgi:hypothetical protein